MKAYLFPAIYIDSRSLFIYTFHYSQFHSTLFRQHGSTHQFSPGPISGNFEEYRVLRGRLEPGTPAVAINLPPVDPPVLLFLLFNVLFPSFHLPFLSLSFLTTDEEEEVCLSTLPVSISCCIGHRPVVIYPPPITLLNLCRVMSTRQSLSMMTN